MAYRVTFTDEAEMQRRSLPFTAKTLLRLKLAQIAADPTAHGRSAGGDMRRRQCEFGSYGLVYYWDDMKSLVTVTGLIWAK